VDALEFLRYNSVTHVPVSKAPLFLRPDHIAILVALWEDIHQGKKRGLGRRQLKERFVRKSASADSGEGKASGSKASLVQPAEPIFDSEWALYAQVGHLKQIVSLVETNKRSSGGKPSDVYTIALEKAVTWPTTARILVEIHDADDLTIEEDILVKQIMKMRLKRSADGSELSEAAIKNAIAWVSDDKRDPPYIRREGDILTARPRLKFEIDYLKAIAVHAATATT
jgi:hypothetical protein